MILSPWEDRSPVGKDIQNHCRPGMPADGRRFSARLLVQWYLLLDAPRRVFLEVVAVAFERFDGGEQVVGQRLQDLQTQLDVRLALVRQADGAVRRVLALAVITEAARPARAQD